MKREIHKWFSPNLNKEMEIVVYGHYGFGLLLFPTDTCDYLEYERFDLIESIRNFINSGTLKAYSINSINGESWLNKNMSAADKAVRQQQYNRYITDEVIPFIHTNCGSQVPVIAAGASMGAYHAANSFFRRPDLFAGVIALSGTYDLKDYCNGHYDDNIYFNSPLDYIPNLVDSGTLTVMRHKNIVIACGQGDYEDPDSAYKLSGLLHDKDIPHWLDVWGTDMHHDWPTWRLMLPHFLENLNL